MPGGRFSTENTSLRMLLSFAYDVREHQISGGPAWVATEPWDINAKPEKEVPQGPEGTAMLKQLMRTLLAERFGVVLKKESKEMPVYALVAAKGGPKLKALANGSAGNTMRMGMGEMNLTGGIPLLAAQLARVTGRTVNDETGLTGSYELTLKWTPDPAQLAQIAGTHGGPTPEAGGQEGPSIYTALQEQLGLLLDSRKGQVDTYVVEHAEKPSEN